MISESEIRLKISNASRVVYQAVKYFQTGDPLVVAMQNLKDNRSYMVYVQGEILKIESIDSNEVFQLAKLSELKSLPGEKSLEKLEMSLQEFLKGSSLQVSAGLEGKVKYYKESSRNFSMTKFASLVKDNRADLILAQIPLKSSDVSPGTDQIINALDKFIGEFGQPINYEHLKKFNTLVLRRGKSLHQNQTTLYFSRLIDLPKVKLVHHFKHGVLKNELEDYLSLVRNGESSLIKASRRLFLRDPVSSALFEEKIKKISGTINIFWDGSNNKEIEVFNTVCNFRDPLNSFEGDLKSGFRMKYSQAGVKALGEYFFDIRSPAFVSYLIGLLISKSTVCKNKILFFKNKYSANENIEAVDLFSQELAEDLSKLRMLAEESLLDNNLDEYNRYKDKYCKETLKILCLCLVPDDAHKEKVPPDFFITEGSLNALAKTFFVEAASDG